MLNRLNQCVWIFLCSVTFCLHNGVYAQIKIGNNPGTINQDAVLEIESADKGLLLPRLALNNTTSPSPLKSFVAGMFVYDTATINDITPGIYYSDGTKWIKANAASADGSWKLDGNNNSTSTQSFLGTKDNAPLIVKTNNTEHLRITENGNVGIGTSNPSSALEVNGELVIDSIQTGDISTDKVLVTNPSNGKVKMVSAESFMMEMQKRTEVVATAGQSIFNTPDVITDVNKILVYRNGVLISFKLNNINSIESEMPCSVGDEIRIFQLN